MPATKSGPIFTEVPLVPTVATEPLNAGNPNAGWAPRQNAEQAADAKLVAASARLRIQDPQGHSCGTGTVIDAREGEALILTCGHIFRDSEGKGRIEVDLFGPGGERKIPGRLISYDLKRDVGLVAIRIKGPVTTARVAGPDYRAIPGDAVVSVGCNNGSSPSARRSKVTSLDKFLGPPNLQVAGLPVEGRSGGGLFAADGHVIGVCNAADPEDNEGLYAALASIHSQLDEAGLSYIYKSGLEPLPASNAGPNAGSALASAAPPPMPHKMPSQMPNSARPMSPLPPPSSAHPTALQWSNTATAAAGLSSQEQAALDQIRRQVAQGAEVVCVIRSKNNPTAGSQVITLDNASPAFLQQLAAQTGQPDNRRLTSLDIPDRRSEPAGTPARNDSWSRSPSPGGWQSRN